MSEAEFLRFIRGVLQRIIKDWNTYSVLFVDYISLADKVILNRIKEVVDKELIEAGV